jgi:hypothetical protein
MTSTVLMTANVARRIVATAALGLAGLVLSTSARAIDIGGTDPTETLTDSIASCEGRDGKFYKDCVITASYSPGSLTGDDSDFKASFDAWNEKNPAGGKWTLADGGALPGGKFEINEFDADARSTVGELKIRIGWIYDGADKSDYKWSQAIAANFTRDPPGRSDPYVTMDVGPTAGCSDGVLATHCPPLYRFQYDDRHFFDGPRAPWPDSSFDGYAILSKVDRTTRTLTIYEGVEYGFKLAAKVVPEPETWVFMVVLGAGVAWRVRRGQSSTRSLVGPIHGA